MGAFVRLVFGFWFLVFGLFGFVSADPTGPDSLNITDNETWAGSASGSEWNVSGGYLSKINVSATVQNRNWKAFVGWIQGKFVLDDSGGSSIYDWSLSSTGGQVYAARNDSVDWGNIGCANATEISAEDVALEHSGEDNISSTFSDTNLETYSVAGFAVGVGDCASTNTYLGNATQTGIFEEFVLAESSNVIFGAEINDDSVGFDGTTYDFQMIVPQNGNESVGDNTIYYLYVELN